MSIREDLLGSFGGCLQTARPKAITKPAAMQKPCLHGELFFVAELWKKDSKRSTNPKFHRVLVRFPYASEEDGDPVLTPQDALIETLLPRHDSSFRSKVPATVCCCRHLRFLRESGWALEDQILSWIARECTWKVAGRRPGCSPSISSSTCAPRSRHLAEMILA